MASNAARGAYYKSRTREHFERQGWQVAAMERVHYVSRPDEDRPGQFKQIPIKRDQFGSDLLMMRGEDLVFVQVKGGAQAEGSGTFPDARRKFAEFRYPSWSRQWVVAWPTRAREPRIVDCTGAADAAVRPPDTEAPRRQRQPRTTLF